ncbi:unnamed protein product [Triticum turgidum subsp. durum]|uniref:CRIB domain-containing protein n=1 Tax=Triticum turgidum subsp. durum TaxID=4567 RepID=A0A9R0XNM5_TRITD|nr:unnamed protein product [Triticum turgidum subsp. durum]
MKDRRGFPSSTTTQDSDRVLQEEGNSGEEKAKERIVSAGVQRLLKGIKTFFAAYDSQEEDKDEEREIVIGYPTDVQHVGHIGWDGLSKVGGMVGAFSLPSSLPLRQLETAMDPGAVTTICTD